MEEKKIIKGVTDTLSGKMLYEFTIPIRDIVAYVPVKQSLWDKLQRKKPEPIQAPEKERTFQIWPCVAVNQYRIAGHAAQLPRDLFEDPTKMLSYVPEHLPTMIYIIAAAIQNNKHEPDPALIEFLQDNLDNIDITQILSASLQATNMQSFSVSILLMQGEAAILQEGSPQDGSGLIASHIEP